MRLAARFQGLGCRIRGPELGVQETAGFGLDHLSPEP